MAAFINPMSYVEDNTISDHEENKGMGTEDDKVNLDLFIDDEPAMDNKPSDYYGFTDVSQSQTYASAEKDVYSESNMRVFHMKMVMDEIIFQIFRIRHQWF